MHKFFVIIFAIIMCASIIGLCKLPVCYDHIWLAFILVMSITGFVCSVCALDD